MCLERYRTIRQYISRNPGCTVQDIEAYFDFGVSLNTINFEINSLMNNGIITYGFENNRRRFYVISEMDFPNARPVQRHKDDTQNA